MTSIRNAALVIATAVRLWITPSPGFAQKGESYPNKPIRIVLGGAAGSQNDTLARLLASKLQERWGQPVVIDNRSGAGGVLGSNIVAKAAPDGYTLLHVSPQFAIGAALGGNLPYDPIKDFIGVTQIGYSTVVLVVTPALGAKSVKEFVALAKARPSPILFSSAGAGSSMHMYGERFRFAAGIKTTHVGFKGASEAVIEVMAGRVQYSVPGLGVAVQSIKDGKLTALAVNAPRRSALLPDVPTMAEALPGYEKDGSYGLLAPAKTPRAILNKISADIRQVYELPDIKERFNAMGFASTPSTPEEYDKILRTEIETFTKVAKLVGLRAQ